MGIGPNNWMFRDFPDISLDGVLFKSFEALKFVHRCLYCTYENILCLYQYFLLLVEKVDVLHHL